MQSDWEREKWKAKALQARIIPIPEIGESERVPLLSVFARTVWFKTGGLYILREDEIVQYLGLTVLPLRVRLANALVHGKTWTKADWSTWTVTMQRVPEPPEDLALEFRLTAQYAPRYHMKGRPRKRPVTFEGDGEEDGSTTETRP